MLSGDENNPNNCEKTNQLHAFLEQIFVDYHCFGSDCQPLLLTEHYAIVYMQKRYNGVPQSFSEKLFVYLFKKINFGTGLGQKLTIYYFL